LFCSFVCVTPTTGAKAQKAEGIRQPVTLPTRERSEWSGQGVDGLPPSAKKSQQPDGDSQEGQNEQAEKFARNHEIGDN